MKRWLRKVLFVRYRDHLDFITKLPHNVRYVYAGERHRLEGLFDDVLRDPWRPPELLVPWPEPPPLPQQSAQGAALHQAYLLQQALQCQAGCTCRGQAHYYAQAANPLGALLSGIGWPNRLQ